MKVERVGGMSEALAKRKERFKDVVVNVGYEAEYAIAVHEDIEMKLRGITRPSGIGVYWGPHGQAKFLEEPAKINRAKYGNIVKDVVARGGTLEQGMLAAGAALLRDSQQLVPVEYGNLRASGFVEVKKR